MSAPTRHIPVMGEAVVAALAPRSGGFYIDGTFGGGGYTRALLAAAPCRVLGLDRDPAALARGAALVSESAGRLSLVEASFADMDREAARLGVGPADGVALDLGVSSDQLDEPARGFSFLGDGPLDMRLGSQGRPARDLVNSLSEGALAELLRVYGEEPRARRIARAIVAARQIKPLERTSELAAVVARAAPARPGSDRLHPATRTFQALRIAVNDELGELARGLGAAERALAPQGRLAVVAFHSLEDRIVKRFLQTRSGRAPASSRHRPPKATEPAASFELLARHAASPSADEIARNPRARSARLRIAERTAAPPHPLDLAELAVPSLAYEGAIP